MIRLFLPSLFHFGLMGASLIGGVAYVMRSSLKSARVPHQSRFSHFVLLYQLLFFTSFATGLLDRIPLPGILYPLGLLAGIMLGGFTCLREIKRTPLLALLSGSFAFLSASLFLFLFLCD